MLEMKSYFEKTLKNYALGEEEEDNVVVDRS